MKRDFEDRLFYHRIDKAKRTVELFIPFAYAEDRIAVASVILPMKDIPHHITDLYRQCALMAALILALHTFIIISRTLVLPLRSLLDATRTMSAGMLDVSIAIVRKDEIGALGRSFNEMAVSMRRLRDEARESNPLTCSSGMRGGTRGNRTSASFIALFDEGAPFFYSVSDRQNGCIESFDRKGNQQRFPLMTVSIAVVRKEGKLYDRHQQMAEAYYFRARSREGLRDLRKTADDYHAIASLQSAGEAGRARGSDACSCWEPSTGRFTLKLPCVQPSILLARRSGRRSGDVDER